MWWKKKKDDHVDPEEDFAWIEEYIAKQMAKDPRVRLKEYMTDMTKAIEYFRPAKEQEIAILKMKWLNHFGFELDLLPLDPIREDINYYMELIELDKKDPNALAQRGYHFVSRTQRK
jgi:hypothetical protein